MGSAFGAGAGADALQEILARKFREALGLREIANREQQTQQQGVRDQATLKHYGAMEEEARQQTDLQRKRFDAEAGKEAYDQNQGVLRGAMQGSFNAAGTGDPNGAKATRDALRVVMAGSGAAQKDIPQEPVAPKPQMYPVTVKGIGGVPVRKLVSGDELQGGVEEYRAPEKPAGQTHARFNIVQGADANGKPAMIRTNVDTGDIEVLPVPAGANFVKRDQPATADQTNLAIYASRVSQAEPTLKALEASVAAMNPLSYLAQTKIDNPAVQSKEMQQYQQAARQFINSVLRRESGAAISAGEFDSARKQYLPMPMDTPEVLAQKAAARADVLAQFQKAAGPAGQKPVSAAPAGNGPKRVKYDLNGNVIKD